MNINKHNGKPQGLTAYSSKKLILNNSPDEQIDQTSSLRDEIKYF